MYQRIKDASLFLGLWGGFLFVHRFVVGTHYVYLGHDSNAAVFALGVNWLTGNPNLWATNPAPTINILSGLILAISGINGAIESYERFLFIGTWCQGLIVLFGAVWFSWAADLLNLPVKNRIVLVLLVLGSPPLLAFLGYWGNYFELGLLGLPIGITILATLRGNSKSLIMSGVGCGLLAANNYPSLAILGALLVTLSYQSIRSHGLSTIWTLRISKAFIRKNSVFLLFLAVCLVGSPIAYVAWNISSGFNPSGPLANNPILSFSVIFFCGTILWIVVGYLCLIYFLWDCRVQKILTSSLITFVFGNFVLLPWYPWGLWGALSKLTESSSEEIMSFSALFAIPQEPWLAVFWLIILMMIYVVIRMVTDTNGIAVTNDKYGLGLLFSVLSITVILIGIGSTITIRPDIPGVDLRQLIAIVPSLAIGWIVVISSLKHSVSNTMQGTIVALILISVVNYFADQSNSMLENRSQGEVVDNVIKEFLEQRPNGVVVCGRDGFYSVFCRVSYAYNRFRTIGSEKVLPTKRLFGDKVVWLSQGNTDEEILRLMPQPTEEVLVIADSPLNKRLTSLFCRRNHLCAVLPQIHDKAFLVESKR